MTNDETTPPREAVRPAVACYVADDAPDGVLVYAASEPVIPDEGDRPALAIDNATGDGLVARVRDAVFAELYGRLTLNGYSDGQAARVCVAVSDAAIRALGVTP